MSECPGRVMVIGAHPDDADFRAGGCAKLWKDLGFEVLFISATNGDAGHHAIGGGMLAQRRAAEAKASGDVIGIEYRLLEIHDAELVPSLEYRKLFITLIREFAPDLLFTHRPWDYHPDHRYTGQLVMDASFLVTVPNVCPLARHMDQSPVIMYLEDGFQKPLPFQPDVVVDIDPALPEKGLMLHSHASQVYEWLSRGVEVPTDPQERIAWSREWVRRRSHHTAERFRAELIAAYGEEHGGQVECAEAFEVCEYGSPLTDDARRKLFPFLP